MSRLPLFNIKTIKNALLRAAPQPSQDQIEAARAWAATASHSDFAKAKETSLDGQFCERFVQQVLGYKSYQAEGVYTVAQQEKIGGGAVDLALGHFETGSRKILAPFELKGAKTKDLDAIMPGRAKTPVQQAWEYAMDAVGSRWVLVSNYVELRLYAVGYGRAAYEVWDLRKLSQPDELQRLLLLVGAEALLGGATAELLVESAREDKDITEALYKDYKSLRDNLIQCIDDQHANVSRLEAIRFAQTLLDRILFIAFSEDTDLLPARSVERAFDHSDPYNPKPVWENFKGLFRAIDKGNRHLNIPPYNGGLFAENPALDSLALPDHICEGFRDLAAYDYRSEVSVSVLGHIFEQSISDIEALQAEARGEEAPASTKKKREGVVYTPEFVTRFIVEKTIGRHLAEIRDGLLKQYAKSVAENAEIEWKTKNAELNFWQTYLTALQNLTVVDPACGSGAFLIAAFDYLHTEYNTLLNRLADLQGGTVSLFDADREIVTSNLFGVDVNESSVEITKLSLWLKTAKKSKPLQSLEENIRCGNSLIETSDYHYAAFEWHKAFPGIFERGGFDIVLGNPPYVRMELIKPFKPYLEKRYEVVSDRADLYSYFFERGIRLLKQGGRLGYISSSTFFRTGSGKPLRDYLLRHAAIETVVDFGDLQIFEGVTTYPAIMTLQRKEWVAGQQQSSELSFLNLTAKLPNDLSGEFAAKAQIMPQTRLTGGSWQFEGDRLAALRQKIMAGRKTLKEVYGAPLYGIKTGLNEAFIISRARRDELIARDAKSAELLVPFLRGENVKRWHIESDDLWLVNIPKGKVLIDDYPAIKDHLLSFKGQLEARATTQEWYELQQAQLNYQPIFRTPKIVYQDICNSNPFVVDLGQNFLANTCYFIDSEGYDLLGFLNSKIAWFFWSSLTNIARGGYLRLRSDFVEQTPVPDFSSDIQYSDRLIELSKECQGNAALRRNIIYKFQDRIVDLCPLGVAPKLSQKLQNWWKLDFAAFRAEIKKTFKTEIPLKERGDWESYLQAEGDKVRAFDVQISKAETEIDAIVYRLFGLSSEEIDLLEASLKTTG